MSLKENLIEFLSEEPKTIKECYDAFPDYEKHSVRARLNENVGKCFKRITKGVYLAVNGEAQALIIEGDAWQRIKDIESDSVDFVITDSPYSCANRWVSMGTTRKTSNTLTYATRDLDSEMYAELWRVMKKSGHLFLFFSPDTEHTLPYNNTQLELAQAQGFTFNKRFIWDKMMIGMGYNGRCKYDQIFFLSKGDRHKPYDLGVPDLLSHKRVSAQARVHEAEKPVELIEDLIKIAGREGDVGLDLFGGSFNFIQACFNRGCHAIAIDIDHAFCEQAIKRFGATEVSE